MSYQGDIKDVFTDSGAYYLKLSPNALRFEAVSKARLNNVFFDDANSEVFTVQSSDVTEVTVKCPCKQNIRTFKIQEKGPVISIKFSPDGKILAIQRTRTSVEFINFYDNKQSQEYSQSCKGKNAKILGFIWANSLDILLITDLGVEMYQVEPGKCSLKHLKSLSLSINWFTYCPHTCILLISSGTVGNSIQPMLLKNGNIVKLNRFEIELSIMPKPAKLSLLERDVTLAVLYDQPRVLVLKHQRTSISPGAEVLIYTVQKMSTVKKTNILKLDRNGRFAINIVDNLILVHHQASKTSLVYDIGMESEYDGTVWHHSPVTRPQPILAQDCDLYSPNWVMFQPNIIIDPKVGSLWHIELCLEPFTELIQDKCFLVDFLMLRSNSKDVIIKVLRDTTQNCNCNLEEIGNMFDHLNAVYRNYLEVKMQSQIGLPVSSPEPTQSEQDATTKIIIDQSDMYTNVLSKLADHMNDTSSKRYKKFIVWVLLEYIRSLTDFRIPVQHYLHELIINSLVLNKAYYQLHQLLQYYTVSDSKPLACLLLSLENLYPAAHQLAVDMLERLGNAHEEITEVLLSKQQILPALRYAINMGTEDQVSARKFLEVAQAANDDKLFYSVFSFFEVRNQRLNGSIPSFR